MLLPSAGNSPQMNVPNLNTRIYVGSIHWDLSEADLKTEFEAFGKIKSCILMPNPETGKHKGYGFIEFEDPLAATQAIAKKNGVELAGRPMKVGPASSASMPSPALFNAAANIAGALQTSLGLSSNVTASAINAFPSLSHAAAFANSISQRKAEETLSHEENVTISGSQRYQLMRKLANAREISKASEQNSRCIVLHDMVTAREIDDELEREVTEECSKFGMVEKVVIYQDNPQDEAVKIYILFQNAPDTRKAFEALNGRWFAGRQIRAEFSNTLPGGNM